MKVVFGGLIFKIVSQVEIARIPSGFLKAGRPDGRCWTWDGVSLLIMDLRSGLLENVFDVDYRRHGSGINEPGRNLVVRFEQSF